MSHRQRQAIFRLINQDLESAFIPFIDHPKLFLSVRNLVAANVQLADEKALLEQENHLLKAKYADLLEQVRLLKHQRFASRSEKYRVEQQDLFNEAETEADDADAALENNAQLDDQAAAIIGGTNSSPLTQAKRGRKALPAELPRVEIIHDLPLDQQHCSEGHDLKVIGDDCRDAGGTTPRMEEVESRLEQRSRATQERLPKTLASNWS